MWRAHILDNINRLTDEDTLWSFVTITAPARSRDAHDSYYAVNRAWRVITELWRAYHRWYDARNIHYVRVLEAHSDGAVHAHAIIGHDRPLHDYNTRDDDFFTRKTKWCKRATLRFQDICAIAGAGYIADVSAISGHAGYVASYVTKYITKDNQSALDLPKRARRMLTSRSFQWREVGDDEELTWDSASSLDWQTYLELTKDAKRMHDIQLNQRITLDTFEHGLHYPPHDDRD
jgi:hypothetical protein